MNKRQKDFERWAMPRLKKIQKILLLEHFEPLTLKYFKKLDNDAYASFQWTNPYLNLQVNYSDHLLDDFYKGELRTVEGCLVHELAHALTDPVYDLATRRYVSKDSLTDEREKLTDHIANIVLKNKLI